jgi:hypothetical protein
MSTPSTETRQALDAVAAMTHTIDALTVAGGVAAAEARSAAERLDVNLAIGSLDHAVRRLRQALALAESAAATARLAADVWEGGL